MRTHHEENGIEDELTSAQALGQRRETGRFHQPRLRLWTEGRMPQQRQREDEKALRSEDNGQSTRGGAVEEAAGGAAEIRTDRERLGPCDKSLGSWQHICWR